MGAIIHQIQHLINESALWVRGNTARSRSLELVRYTQVVFTPCYQHTMGQLVEVTVSVSDDQLFKINSSHILVSAY